MKENDYLCPSCKGHLNTGGNVVFSTKNSRNSKGLILLSPKAGEYTYSHHSAYNLKKDEIIDFHCPICSTNLTSPKNESYVSINMVDHNNEEYEVLFSRKVGDKSTYVVAGQDQGIEEFGEDALNFDDVF